MEKLNGTESQLPSVSSLQVQLQVPELASLKLNLRSQEAFRSSVFCLFCGSSKFYLSSISARASCDQSALCRNHILAAITVHHVHAMTQHWPLHLKNAQLTTAGCVSQPLQEKCTVVATETNRILNPAFDIIKLPHTPPVIARLSWPSVTFAEILFRLQQQTLSKLPRTVISM